MLKFSRNSDYEFDYQERKFYNCGSRRYDKTKPVDRKERKIFYDESRRQREIRALKQDLQQVMKTIDDWVEQFCSEKPSKKLEKSEVKVVRVEPKVAIFNDKKDENIEEAIEIVHENLPKEKEVKIVVAEVKVDDPIGETLEEKADEIPVVQSEGEKALVTDISSSLQTSRESCHRENLFQARCVVHEKVCKLVVDGGSCANVVSKEFVKKMNLQVFPHPEPYSLRWLNSPDVLHIHKQAQVPIGIGDYIDTITCDIAPMDCAQVLLGRPWQYDRRAVHDGYHNTYKIRKDGQTFLLLPMTLTEAQQERFDHVRGKGQRNLSLFPCRSSKKKIKPTQKFQEFPHVSKENPSQMNAKIRGRIFSKKEGMMGIEQPQVSKNTPKLHYPLSRAPRTSGRVKRVNQRAKEQMKVGWARERPPALPGVGGRRC